jgi:alpha-D-ribose 1-methylphosphonate 5-triphosphate diphosphatase
MRLQGGQVLIECGFVAADVEIDDGAIASIGRDGGSNRTLDARDLHVLPGIVDIHGDAFERQVMPRPGVAFPLDIALADSDRQAISNGITTVFHSVTCSWEPGLRGIDNAGALLSHMESLRDRLQADTRFHLRYETYNLDAEDEVLSWLSERRVDLLAFNDHMPSEDIAARTRKLSQMAERAGLSREDFLVLVERLRGRAAEVPDSIARVAGAARDAAVPMLSHDDMSPEQRNWFRDLDCRLCEFPTNVETAEAAAQAGDDIVLGAPNVVRGGSHIGWIGAADMISRGFCTILASDYYYPAPLLAAFRLAADGIAPLAQAWSYVAANPAKAAGLEDRGTIAEGRRADLILVDGRDGRRPSVVATVANGQLVHLTQPGRLN